MALGNNNNSSDLNSIDLKEILKRNLPSWLQPTPKPLPTPIWEVPNGTTSYYGFPRGPQCDACLAWLDELFKAQNALAQHDIMVADKTTELYNILVEERRACAERYKDSPFPIGTIGFGICQHDALSKFEKAVSELQAAYAPARAALAQRIAKAKEGADFWCQYIGWPPNGQPLPNQQFYPVPPPAPGSNGGWRGYGGYE